MNKSKKRDQLGIDPGTATSRLKKGLLFKYVKLANDNFCYRCGEEIDNAEELSVEHKIPWLDSKDPISLFFDLDNVSFSHLSCNIKAARRPTKGKLKHPSNESYKRGCRCDECKCFEKNRRREQRKKGIKT
jgi:HNH endonuclease